MFRAFDESLRRDVAVKLLRASGRSAELLAAKVLNEGRLLARVRHRNVVTVHGVDTHDGRVGLWMEFIRGNTLEQLLERQGPFGGREASLLGQDLCRALAAVHAAGLVHRDVKAQNVIREEGGRLVLMDFGTGLLLDDDEAVRASPVAGTPLYLSPEVLAGSDASPQSDIYSLGVLLFHLVTGSYPDVARGHWPSCGGCTIAASASACTTCGPTCRKASSTSSSAPSSPIPPSGTRASAPCSAA